MMRFGFRGGVRVHICPQAALRALLSVWERNEVRAIIVFHRVQRFDPREQR